MTVLILMESISRIYNCSPTVFSIRKVIVLIIDVLEHTVGQVLFVSEDEYDSVAHLPIVDDSV